MKKLLTKGQLSVLIVFGILIIDQIIKILVKTNMYWHESIRITDWFYIYFTENNGMAFGMEIFGKLFLTTFRIVAVGLIIWYLAKIVKQNYKTGYIVCISLILAGAIGNIIDSVFYGVIFNESTHSTIASFVPVGEGCTRAADYQESQGTNDPRAPDCRIAHDQVDHRRQDGQCQSTVADCRGIISCELRNKVLRLGLLHTGILLAYSLGTRGNSDSKPPAPSPRTNMQG